MPPFPQEPAFNSPGAVAQAAETIREETAEHGMGFGLLTEALIEDGLIDPPERPPYQQIVLLEAERDELREQRDALADALELQRQFFYGWGMVRDHLGVKGTAALDKLEAATEAALRLAGRLP